MKLEILSDEMISSRIQLLLSNTCHQNQETFGSHLNMRFLRWDPDRSICYLSARTARWMCNPGGTVHGGICASIADEAMGLVAYCLKEGQSLAPTIELQLSFHRPLPPDEEILIQVRPVSVTRRLIHLSAEVSRARAPESLCFSSTATFFCKDNGSPFCATEG